MNAVFLPLVFNSWNDIPGSLQSFRRLTMAWEDDICFFGTGIFRPFCDANLGYISASIFYQSSILLTPFIIIMKHISPFVMALLFLFITGYQELEAQQYIRYRKTVFEAGKDGIDSYRIPSLVVTPKGTMLAFCEARKISSTDKTPTDIAVKRSTDKGKTWSQIQFLTGGNKEAYMDPVALVNQPTGTILLFANRWPPGDRSMRENTAWLIKSSDDGQTWSEPENITASLLAPGHLLNGFGPGSGTQMQGPRFKPARFANPPIGWPRSAKQNGI